MKSIVVGLHPSRPVSPALDWAVAQAVVRHRPLELLVARGVPVPAQIEVPVDTLLPDEAAQEVIDQARQHVAQIDPSVQVEGRVCNGSAGAVLVAASAEAEAVVVGRHGHSRLTEAVLGSTSAQVAAHGQAPVVVVDDRLLPDTAGPVVCGVDGSSANRAAIDYSFRAASEWGVPLVALYAWQLDLPEQVTLPWINKPLMRRLVEEQKRVLHEALAGWSTDFPDVEVRHIVSRQHAVDRLSEEARSASLLVVGGRGHGGFAGLLVGSVSRAILHRRHTCPIVIVHPG